MDAPPRLILVAEDEPLASMALRAQLEALGHAVVGPAHDGDEALALGLCHPVDVALFDYSMPRRNGLEAARALFDQAPTPVILLSGFDFVDLPDPIPRPPIFASLTKPADLSELRAALASADQGFRQWVDAEPNRRPRVADTRARRQTIARAVALLAGDAAPAAAAVRLVARADEENRSVIAIADELLAGRT